MAQYTVTANVMVDIKATSTVSAETMAMTLADFPNLQPAQSMANIRIFGNVSVGYTNASVVKYAKQIGLSQGQARIYGFPCVVAQSQATIV